MMSITPLKLTAPDGAYIGTARVTDAGRPAVLPSHDRWHALPSVHQRASPQSPALDGETRQHDDSGSCRELPRFPHYLSWCSSYCSLARRYLLPVWPTAVSLKLHTQATPHAASLHLPLLVIRLVVASSPRPLIERGDSKGWGGLRI